MIAAWLAAPEVEMTRLLFASLRTAAALALLPGIGAMLLPLRARIGLALAVGLLVEQVAGPVLPAGPALIGAVVHEVAVGAGVGVVLQAVFAVASVAGELLSQAMGLGFATITQPGGTTAPVIADFVSLGAWLAFVGGDGVPRLLGLIVASYQALPGDGGVDPGAVVAFGGTAFASGLIVALPMVAVLLLANVWLAVLARSAPALNLFQVGYATLMATGLAALPLAWPAMTEALGSAVTHGDDALAALLGG